MNMRSAAVLVSFAIAAAAHAAEPDPALVAALAANRHPIRLHEGKLDGAGARLLLDEAAKSQFFLLGEDHGLAETGQIAEAMVTALQPLGYRHIAVEAGPVTSERLERLARDGGAKSLATFAAANAFSLPFFGWAEEQSYLAAAVRAYGASSKRVVWGLDQEFVFAAGYHLDELAQLAPDVTARAEVRGLKERNDRGLRRLATKKDPSSVLMMKATAADFDALAADFPKSGEAARLIGEMKESADIYQMWVRKQGYESNLQRSLLMKRHFAAYYDEAVRAGEPRPRVLLKFGLNHMMRGRTYVDVYDLGTLLPELAASNGMQAFHVAILARGGTVNAATPMSEGTADRKQPYDPLASRNLDFDGAPFLDTGEAEAWTLIDLRPLRKLLSAKKLAIDEGGARLIWAYDAMIVIPVAHAARTVE